MQIVDDKRYSETLQTVFETLKAISSFTKEEKTESKENSIVLISLIPTFAFTQLLTYITLGEYLRTRYRLNIKYLIDDAHLLHCDMVNMQDPIDRELLCFRCSHASELLIHLAPHQIITLSSLTDIQTTPPKEELLHQYIRLSKERYCGKLNYPKYELYAKENLHTMYKAAKRLCDSYTIDAFITLRHNSVYSLATMNAYFHEREIYSLNIDQGAFKENALSIFGKSGDVQLQKNIYNSLQFTSLEEQKIERYLRHRTKTTTLYDNENYLIAQLKEERKNGKKIVAFFPNVLEDASLEEYHSLFNSPLEWLIESIEFALREDYTVLIKPHPHEKKWRVQKGVCEQLQEHFAHDNIIYLPHDFSSAYNLIDFIDLALLYTGTLFLELAALGLPTLAAGDTYIMQHTFCKELTKERYFSLMLDSAELQKIIHQDYKNILKIAYIEFFCRDIPLSLTAEEYPYRDKSDLLKLLHSDIKEPAFEAIYELITTQTIQIDRYKNQMEIETYETHL